MNSEAFEKFAAAVVLALGLGLAGCKAALPADDTALNAAVQAKLAADAAISAEPIQTFVQAGVATLQGSVSSDAARALAASDAAQVAGIRTVVNNLTVETSVQTARQTPPAVPPASASIRASKQAPAPRPQPTRNAQPPANQRADQHRIEPADQQAPVERRRLLPDPQTAQQAAPPALTPPAQPAPPTFRNLTIPSGTTLPVRITQTLDSGTTQPGDAFSGAVASDVLIDGLVAIPAGTTVNGRVDEVHEAAHFKGSALLTISLVSLNRRGDRATLTTEPYTKEGKGRGTNTAEKVGGGATVGAILGGIFGGGKGAAIGAAAGGGVGAGAQGITRGQQAQIPSESLIQFRLTNPVEVRVATPGTGGSN